ncbi:thiopurine S-methyltransferase-like [Centruroides sculpturatus]|uniref:thiopurine S-methyltransferase-like n=1 Tax=Centruroides sculpturatus TaxID=218467 RepID=UPI000C6D3335|nr:thiopurine S-methyltransferase-like [Centruroides sculpturatus]
MATNAAVLEKWVEKWEANKIPWHRTINNRFLLNYYDKLINGRSSIQIFFPMCGKSIDMKWLYDKGHKIVGVEYCEKAIKDFYEEQGLQYEVENVESVKGKLFKTSDDNIKIFCCDIFLFNKEYAGLMDAVWDRGAFEAVEKEDRKRYFINSILKLSYLQNAFQLCNN